MWSIVVLVVALAFAGPAWAKSQGKSHGGNHGNVVTHAPATTTLAPTPSRPPGLARQDKLPHGLEQQDKTPAGWSKGQKRGWFDWLKPKKKTEPTPALSE